jgi:predicted RNA-binding Zn-ribbon protein involved in translation (DUF1610 family)
MRPGSLIRTRDRPGVFSARRPSAIRHHSVLIFCLLVAIASAGALQSAPPFSRFAEHLARLTPDEPAGYLEVGEQIADAASSNEERALATTLLVLAAELDRSRLQGGQTAASACIALADLATGQATRRWLFSLARSLDPAQVFPDWTQPAPPSDTSAEGYQLATILGLIRAGDGIRARNMLARPGVRQALFSHDVLLSRLGAGSASALVRQADRWPCPECGNQRLSRRSRAENLFWCTNCAGNPGPRLSRNELLAQLRFEAWVLHGQQRSWAAQTLVDFGEPLLDPDPATLPRVFGVDPRAVYWRDGRWCHTLQGDCVPSTSAPRADPPPAPAPLGSDPGGS